MSYADLDARGKVVAAGVFIALVVDGMDLQMLALALPSLRSELGLTPLQAGALATWTFAGMGLGGVLAGWLADRFGRARVTRMSVIVFTLMTGLIGLAETYAQIALLRFLSGFGLAALWSIGTLLANEHVPTRIRTTVLSMLQAGWSLGYVVAALVARELLPAYGWRPMFLCAVVPGVLALALLWRAADPPAWIATRGSHAGAGNDSFARLWRDPALRRTFLIWVVASTALQFGYYGANSWLPSYLVGELGLNLASMSGYLAASYAMAVLGKVLVGFMADRFGRRAMWMAAGLLTAAYLPALIHFADAGNVAVLLLLFGFLYGAPFAVASTYLSESFPVAVRGTAVGAAWNIGRIGSMLSPLFIGWAATGWSVGAGIAMLSVAYVVWALAAGLFIRDRLYDTQAVELQGDTT